MAVIRKIFIANRGEIVSRIIRTAKSMGIQTIIVYTSVDKEMDYVVIADHAVLISGESIHDTYLNSELLIDIAKKYHADAIHPGYGFLSEDVSFAALCLRNSLLWIGPSPEVILQLGNKVMARNLAESIGLPILPSYKIESDISEINISASDFPLIIKSASGGGGRGMRVCRNTNDLMAYVHLAKEEAGKFFGDDTVYLEKFIEKAFHIEVQVAGDGQGNVIHFFERECTLQRRYQKIIEEAPSIRLSDSLRKKLFEAALNISKSARLDNIATVEFLVTNDEQFYFLEVNPRIQVEHRLTELITGFDLVALQLNLAMKNALLLRQEDIQIKSYALQCRICAENPFDQLSLSCGEADRVVFHKENGLYIEKSFKDTIVIHHNYDSMFAKLIVHEIDRDLARDKMLKILQLSYVSGIDTNIPLLISILKSLNFLNFDYNTLTIDSLMHSGSWINKVSVPDELNILMHAYYTLFGSTSNIKFHNIPLINVYLRDRISPVFIFKTSTDGSIEAIVNGSKLFCKHTSIDSSNFLVEYNYVTYHYSVVYRNNTIDLFVNGSKVSIAHQRILNTNSEATIKEHDGRIRSPMPGKVIKVFINRGEMVSANQEALIIESMKTENSILIPVSGMIEQLLVKEGDVVSKNSILFHLNSNN